MAGYDFGTIEISIDDPKSIDLAVLKVLQLKRGLTKAMNELYKFMLEEGVNIARYEIVRLCDANMMSGELWMSVKSTAEMVFDEETGIGRGYITAGDGLKTGKDGTSYAVYVEFGTGVHSEQAKAKQEAPKTGIWQANLKLPAKRIEQSAPESTRYWKYYNEKDDHYYMTSGQPPKHFMANTMYELWSKAQKKWTELINQYVPHEMG